MPKTAFAFVVLLNGLNAVAIRFTVAELPPFWGGTLRFVAAALIFWGVAVARRERPPRGRALSLVALYGALMFGVSSAFVYWGLAGMAAGPAQVIVGMTPLLTLLLAAAQGQERPGARAVAGAGLAVGGLALAFARGGFVPGPALAILAGALCMAEATILARRLGQDSAWLTNAVAMTAGAAVLLLLTVVTGETPALPHLPVTWAALIYLVVLGSVGLYLLFLYVVAHWRASAAAYVFVLAPLVTVATSWLLEDAPVSRAFLAGAGVALFGVWLGAVRGVTSDE